MIAAGEQDPTLMGCMTGHFSLTDALQYLLSRVLQDGAMLGQIQR